MEELETIRIFFCIDSVFIMNQFSVNFNPIDLNLDAKSCYKFLTYLEFDRGRFSPRIGPLVL